jgi:hypothetical protein
LDLHGAGRNHIETPLTRARARGSLFSGTLQELFGLISGVASYAGLMVRGSTARHRICGNEVRKRKDTPMLVGMIVLGVDTFVAMLGFVTLCDRV